MESSRYRELLFQTARKVFEEAAFALVDPPEEGAGDERSEAISVAVDFEGPFSGFLALSAERELAVIFAANMLGTDEDDPDADAKCLDALKELVNMICGNLLPAVAGMGPEFRIQAPREISREEMVKLRKINGTGAVEMLYVEGFSTELIFAAGE